MFSLMHSSHCTPPLDAFPSSPVSVWSCTGSRLSNLASQDHLSPPTPGTCFAPSPAIVTSPDEFTLQIDVQLDRITGPHRSPAAHPSSRIATPSSKTDPSFQSTDDMRKVQVFLRNKGRWETMYDQFESSPPRPPYNPPRLLPQLSHDSSSDDFSWEAAHPALVDFDDLPDSTRCSLLIHEVSLLVGLTADDEHVFPDDGCLKQSHDIIPFCLPPTKSLTPREHKNVGLPHPDASTRPFNPPVPKNIADSADTSLSNEALPPVGQGDFKTPIPRYKSADAGRPSLSPRRRQGQVFYFEPPLNNAPRRSPVGFDETFTHPRKPPPKPTTVSPPNRCSSLDRLEYSLMKLEAHAPGNHRKSRSEGRSSDHVPQKQSNDKRPSLPPPRRLKRQQSSHEVMRWNLSRPRQFSGPVPPIPRPMLPHQYVMPRTSPSVPLDDHRPEDVIPGSFMDMDIPQPEVWQKRRTSFSQLKSKVKVKGLVSAAKRVSKGVVTWGKNLTGSTKPLVTAQGTTIVHNALV